VSVDYCAPSITAESADYCAPCITVLQFSSYIIELHEACPIYNLQNIIFAVNFHSMKIQNLCFLLNLIGYTHRSFYGGDFVTEKSRVHIYRMTLVIVICCNYANAVVISSI